MKLWNILEQGWRNCFWFKGFLGQWFPAWTTIARCKNHCEVGFYLMHYEFALLRIHCVAPHTESLASKSHLTIFLDEPPRPVPSLNRTTMAKKHNQKQQNKNVNKCILVSINDQWSSSCFRYVNKQWTSHSEKVFDTWSQTPQMQMLKKTSWVSQKLDYSFS